MVLQSLGATSHNQMLGGRQVPHPASTNFDEKGSPPAAKRFKKHRSTDSSLSRSNSDGEDEEEEIGLRTPTSKSPLKDDPNPEGDDDDEQDFVSSSQTDLESTLPPVKNDKQAIDDYETTRAAELVDASNLHDRIGQRKWTRGKSSIYVDAFNLVLDTVLEEESHLFDEAENAVFKHWKALGYEAQYLYVRLFLRKTAAWHRINRLGYYGDIADPSAAVMELRETRFLPPSTELPQSNPGELEAPEGSTLGAEFTFADSSDAHIATLEEASKLLLLDELKVIAKDVKARGKNKKELLQSLRQTSQQQSGLGWKGLKRSDTEESIRSETSATSETFEDVGVNRDTHLVDKILSSTGDCVRLSSAPHKLFERVHLVFYRSTEWTEKSLTAIILAKISRRNYPQYIVSRSTNIFPSRAILLELEAALRTQFRVDELAEGPGPLIENLQKLQEISEAVYPRWRALVAEEKRKEDRVYESGEGAYLRRFSPAWAYTRIIHKGLAPLARFKERQREHELLTELLEQRLFHAARRGSWYQRKALLEEHYMWAFDPSDGRSQEARRKCWKHIALATCEQGLQDRECHVIYHYDLQKRIMKLEKSLKIAKRQQHDFGHALLTKPSERYVKGIRIEKEPARPSSGRRNSDVEPTRRGGKTIWVDEREGGGECGVEEMCLSWYREQGWKGYHCEGGILRTLFGYLMYDILFAYIPNVFQTPYQICPLDLHTDAFFPSRLSEINYRLAEICNGHAQRIVREVYDREKEKETCVVGIDWTFDIDDLEEIVSCFQGEALATICKVMAQEYQQRGGGVPDLFLWHPEEKEIMFSEVKSENDRLSDTQRLWIHVLSGAGVKVELCNAVAKEVRVQAS